MIILIKRRILILGIAVILMVTGTIAFAKAKPKNDLSGLTIAVDPGHGGMDGGASGSTGVLEKNLNLELAKTLSKMLKKSGAKVVMTRDEDISIHSPEAKTIREQKRSDLSKRRSIAQSEDTDMYISIHMNKYPEAKYRGAQLFYAENQKSRDLANCIRDKITEVSKDSDRRELKSAYSTMYILQGTENPAVIVECGFLSNPEEEALLCDKKYQKKLSKAIFEGICDFVKAEKK